MGKNQSASGLTNVIQYSNGNITFVSGSTTLMSISSSGAITTTGVISGSNALSASYASNADTLDGLDSTVFTLTSSFNAQTASFTAFTASILAQTASLNSFSASILSYTASQNILNGTYTLTSSFNAQTASLNSFSSSVLTFTGSASTRLGALESYTSSLNDKTSSFATTGSNTFVGNQVVSGSIVQSGSFTTTGTIIAQTINVQTVTSSIIYSSGSNIFGNALNDSQKFTGSMLITGSNIIANVGAACFSGTATIGSDIILSAANPVVYGGTAVGGVSVSNNTGGSYIKIFGASHATTSNTTAFVNANSTVLTINASGNIGIGTATPCSVLHVYGSNPSLIIQNSAVAVVGNTTNIVFRNLLSTGCIHFAGYIAGIQQSTSANTGDLSFNTYDNGSVVEGIRIASNGNVGIGTSYPCTMLHVQGQATIGCSTYRTRIDGSSAGTWISFGTLACTNSLGRIGTYESSYILDSNNGNISFRFANAEKAYINSSGQACFLGYVTSTGITISTGGGTNIANTVNFDTDGAGTARYYSHGCNPSTPGSHAFHNASSNGTVDNTVMSITSTGNVGIGCLTPQKNLTVNGCIGMSNTYNWGITNDNDTNWGFRVCTSGGNYSTFLSYAGDAGSDRRGGIYNQNGHWVAYGNCLGHFIVQCNLTVGGKITAASAQINGSSLTQTQQLINSTGNFANMVHKVYGASGAFSCLVICVNLQGAGGYGYIINAGGTSGAAFQSGGGYINGTGNFSHNTAVGCGYTVTCHTCAGTDNVVRFMGGGGTHPFASIQMFGSLNQSIDDNNIYMCYF